MSKDLEILKRFIGAQNQRLQDDISKQGYKDDSPYKNNPSNTIYGTPQGTPITMDGVSKRLRVTDNMGNSKILEPNSGEHFFPGSHVVEEEVPIAQYGGAGVMYADRNYQMGGNLPFAQVGKETGKPFKIPDERYEGLTVRDNLEDRNVLGFNKADASRTVNKLQEDAKNAKVVVFAESPTTAYGAQLYDADIKAPLLKKIQNEYIKTKKQIDSIYVNDKTVKALTKEVNARQNKFETYLNKYGQDVESNRLFNEYDNTQKKIIDYQSRTLLKKAQPYHKKLTELSDTFYDKNINPPVVDSTFIKEGENVKKFYNRTQPGVKVDVVPLYGNKELMQDKLKGMTQFDKFAIFGHSGEELAGIPNDTIAKYLDKSKVKDCYFGSCYYEEYLNKSSLKDLKNKTLNYRPSKKSNISNNYWYGFNPNANTFDEGMWSRNGKNHDAARITPIKQGVTHIVKKSQEGGDVDLDAMRGMMKSKIGMGNAFGHPAIRRMSQAMPKTGMTPEGMGTHYMSSMGEYAVPLLQDTGKDQLEYFENPRPSSEDIRFNSPEEAQYFAEHYKEVAPMSTIYNGLQGYQGGGETWGKNLTPEQLQLKKEVERNNRKFETKAKWDEHFAQEKKKKEAKAWVANSMQEAYKSPLMSPGYFTPEGALIGAMQSGFQSGKDLSEGEYKSAAMHAGLAALPFAPQIIKKAGTAFSKTPIKEGMFSTYVTPKEAAIARAERMLAQESKWKVNSNNYTKDKFKNISDNFEEVYANEIDKTPNVLGTNAMGKAFVFKDNGLSPANQSRIAAHETGHFYRNMPDEATEWNSFFDFSKLKHRTRVYLKGKPTASESSVTQPKTGGLNLQKQGVPHGDEIRERAAQLKDYIAQKNGIPLNEDFTVTQTQLDDAIENYVKDTGLDNTMTPMLNSLTDKEGFLKAMNKYPLGIVPLAVGVGQLDQKRNGGIINNNMQQYQYAGPVKLKDERYDNRPVIENTEQYNSVDRKGTLLALKERQDALKDAHELKTTGQIKRPRSVHYNKLAPKQSTLTTQTKSNAELNGQLGLLERPLVYMANPEKLLGDLGVPGMETSELDRQAVMANRFNPNQSRLDRFINNAKIGLGYVPEAAINGALAAAFMPEGSGALGLANETLNPLAGLGNIKTSIAPELRQGLRTAGPSLNSSVSNIGNASKNLEDLNYAKSWAKKYGYELPENLERIAQSDELTNRTVRGLANRHNTFVRGVSTNWDVIGQKNPEVLRHLESLGIDYRNNPQQAAEYMATHIPGDTGYGRYGLQPGENALYLSNSVPTAEGYTYGNGYMVKAKRPTDFSSSNRTEWLTNNDFDAHLGFKGSPFGTGTVKNDYIKRFPTTLRETLAITGDPNKMSELQKAVKQKELRYNDLSHQSWRKYNDKIDLLKYKTDPVYRNKFIMDDAEDRFFLRNSPNIIDKINFKYLNTKRDLDQIYYNALPALDVVKGVYGDPDVWKAFGKNLFGKLDPFSHYAIKGKEGEKMLEAIKSVKVNPETWQNTSRAHINKYTNKLSRKEEGGSTQMKQNYIPSWLQ